MTRIQTTTLAMVVATVIATGSNLGAKQNAGEVALRAAIERQTMAGDVRGAMAVYRALVSDPDRAVAAQALLHLAAAYEAVGDIGQARAEYTRLVERFADQPAAVEARRRLAAFAQGGQAVPSQRAVWTGSDVDPFGQVSPDGRWLTYVDWGHAMNLVVRDLQTNTSRALTDLQPFTTPGWKWHGEAGFSTISKDGTQVAYGWLPADGSGHELRILPMNATPGTPARTLVPARQEINGLSPFDWSPDGQWIAAVLSLRDGSGQIALVSVRDGSTRVLRSVTWRGPERIFFSPDGRLIAYDLPANDDTDQRDIFVMTVDAMREIRAVEHEANDSLVGWSPDGRLVFMSDRTGSPAFFAQPFSDGRPAESASVLRAASGEGMSLGITANGTLLLYRSINDVQIRRAPLSLGSAQLAGPPVSFLRGPVGGASVPDWSPDGRYLAHQGSGPLGGIVTRTLATGEARTVRGLYAPLPRWSPDGRFLLANGRDRRGRTGVYRVDADTGALDLVAEGPMGFGPMPQWSPDGTKIYTIRRGLGVLERTLSTGAERTVFSAPGLVSFEIAPDGKQMAVRRRNPSGNQNQGDANVMVVSIETGEAREILPPTPGASGTLALSLAWTPDSSAVLVAKRAPDGPTELWHVPVTAGQPRRIEFTGEGWTGDFASNGRFSLSRDGRTVAWVSGTRAAEVWAIENLVPSAR